MLASASQFLRLHTYEQCSQPFYHLLVEVSDWSYDSAQPPVAYVAQELLAAPELEDEGASWGQVGACVALCIVQTVLRPLYAC